MAPGSRLQELTAKYMQNPRRFFVPLANEYRIAGDLDRAIALCREHLPAQPGHMSGHIVLGRSYFEKGDYAAARDVFMTSVSLDDENLIALRHLGDIARSRSDAVEARGWYARVLDADPENREIEQLLRSLDTLPSVGDVPAADTAGAEAPTWEPAAESPGASDVTFEAPALAEPDIAPDAAPAVPFGELSSALADPTPPGLRAILGEETGPTFDADLVRVPDAPAPAATRPLETFDLSSLGPSVEAEIGGGFAALETSGDANAHAADDAAPLAEQFGITVEGGGFAFHDLDELVDPAVAGTQPDTLPPVEEADFSAGIETPTATPATEPAPVSQDDELLSRPVFGALASFQSWRTAQERDTPAGVTPQTSVPTPTPEIAAADDDGELFWQGATTDTAATAPEFVTETMAALYAQQGFTRQALDIYRTLLDRSPADPNLTQKVMTLQAALEPEAVDATLEADADKALEFGNLDTSASTSDAASSTLEAMYEASPVTDADPLSDAFGTAWTPDADVALSAGDDWFADSAEAGHPDTFSATDSDLFGFALDGMPAASAESEQPAEARRPAIALAGVLGGAAVAAADETAADMLTALAAQMVGRLPKDPPTLPVPDVLELPSAVAGDEASGASPAPLLSFDRFFSGSGSPPRPRVDTPARPIAVTPRELPPAPVVPSPSLSPTFGGVPVIPPPTATPVPSWAGFDKFVPPPAPPASPRAATPTPESTVAQPTPTGAFWTPAMTPVIPEPQVEPAPRPVTPPAAPVIPPAESASVPEEAPPARRTPPSDFHAWLEGLS